MNEKLKLWFENCGHAAGLHGCGVRLTDGTCLSKSFHPDYPSGHLEETLILLGDSLPSFFTHGLTPRWLTWTFEKGQLRVAERADGLVVGLVVEPNSAAAQNLDLLTEEFFNLDLAD